MDGPPKILDGAELVCFAKVTKSVQPTGKTIHRKNGEILGPAAGLAISQYSGTNSVYLFRCDEDWRVFADTFHDNLEDAKIQAEFEYRGISGCWEIPSKSSN